MSYHFPNNWSIKSLGEIGRCVRGLTYSPDNVVDNGLLVLRSSNIQDGRLSFNDNVYVDLEIDEEFLSKKGDIVICVRNGSKHLIGKSAIVKDDNLKSTHGAFMTVFRSDLNDYIQHLINSDKFYQFVSRDIGATINSINTSNLLRYKFPIPPLPEQKKIAAILTSVDTVIEKTQAQIDKLKDLKTGMMQELLTKGIGHTEFKDSPVGRIPVEWEVKDLGDLAFKIEGGGTPPRKNPDYWGKGYPWATVKDLKSIRLSSTEESITKTGLINSSSKLVPAGTVILATRMAVGKAVVFDCDVTINQDLKAFYPKEKLNNKFLLQWYLYKSKYIASLGTGSTVKGIRVDDLKLLTIAVPPYDEQIIIANKIEGIEVLLNHKIAKIQKMTSLKKALMQDLLTGKVRVKV